MAASIADRMMAEEVKVIVTRTGIWPTPWAWEVEVQIGPSDSYRDRHTLRGNAFTRRGAVRRARHALLTMQIVPGRTP